MELTPRYVRIGMQLEAPNLSIWTSNTAHIGSERWTRRKTQSNKILTEGVNWKDGKHLFFKGPLHTGTINTGEDIKTILELQSSSVFAPRVLFLFAIWRSNFCFIFNALLDSNLHTFVGFHTGVHIQLKFHIAVHSFIALHSISFHFLSYFCFDTCNCSFSLASLQLHAHKASICKKDVRWENRSMVIGELI